MNQLCLKKQSLLPGLCAMAVLCYGLVFSNHALALGEGEAREIPPLPSLLNAPESTASPNAVVDEEATKGLPTPNSASKKKNERREDAAASDNPVAPTRQNEANRSSGPSTDDGSGELNHSPGAGEHAEAPAPKPLPLPGPDPAGDLPNSEESPDPKQVPILDYEPKEAESKSEAFAPAEVPQTLSGPPIFHTSHLNLGIFRYHYSDSDKTELSLTGMKVQGGYAILPELAIRGGFSLGLASGHHSAFLFREFEVGLSYVFYNQRPLVLSVSLDLATQSQSFRKVFSADLFYLRPMLSAAVNVWRITFSPFLGLPVYLDTNEDNDPRLQCPEKSIAGCTVKPGTGFPDRSPDTWKDQNPVGIEYGLPISVLVGASTFISVEASGLTWFYPETRTAVYLTPGILYQAGHYMIGGGLRFRLTPGGPWQDRMDPVFSFGMSF